MAIFIQTNLNCCAILIMNLNLFAQLAVSQQVYYYCFVDGDTSCEKKIIDSIPFYCIPSWKKRSDGQAIFLSALDIKAKWLYIHGGVNSVDLTHKGWGGSNDRESFFIGDKTGQIEITYESGITDSIPLIFGYTTFCRQNYAISPEPFRSEDAFRQMLENALCVANAIDGYAKDSSTYYIRISLRNERLKTIAFIDCQDKIGYAEVNAITFCGVEQVERVGVKKYLIEQGEPMPAEVAAWLDKHTIDSEQPFPQNRQKAIKEIQKHFYTFQCDVDQEIIDSVPLDVKISDFSGPQITFSGSPSASLLTKIYYENVFGLLSRIDEQTGMVHESARGADYYNGFAGWTPKLAAFYGCAYTRFRGLSLLSAMGYIQQADKVVEFFDKWLMYWPNAYPQVQLGGKPVPGHATVIANKPHIYFDELRHVGWPTKYKTRDFGNPENDGHGILMLGRWRTWNKHGRDPDWVVARWEAIQEAAEYILWCLDNPDLSFSEHGLLYSESEGGMQIASLYCDWPCYLGLLAYAEMAVAAGRDDYAQRWRQQAQRFFDAMEKYYPTTIEPWGDVWDPLKTADWNYKQGVLAPLILGTDYYGFDVANRLPKGWRERTERSYIMQSQYNKPADAAPAGLGYGQCYIAQAALLLDRMDDAAQRIEWLAKLIFAPRLPYPYRVPEGVIVKEDGSMWRRWGDLGNLYQLNEVLYTIYLIVGIDDLKPDTLVIMPRLPRQWNSMKVNKWPVRTLSGGISKNILVDMCFNRDVLKNILTCEIRANAPVDTSKVRIGPFATSEKMVFLKINGRKIGVPLEIIGGSAWCWIDAHFNAVGGEFVFFVELAN